VVLVEVRYRRSAGFGGSVGSVDAGKRRRIALAAQAWLDDNRKFAAADCRFDVIAVDGDLAALRSQWLRAAFTLDDLAG
jgi:putative endonuclease